MSSFLQGIRRKVPGKCQARRCQKEGCSLTNKGLQSTPCIVDMDCDELRVPQSQKRCDYILFSDEGGDNWMVPVEMQKGNVHAGKICKQLQRGTDFAVRELLSQDAVDRFLPLAVYRGTLKGCVARDLRKSHYKVKFRSKQYEIELRRSKESLASVLS